MGSQDKEYVQALASGQRFQVEFKAGTEAAKLSGEYRAVEIKPGRGRGGTLNVIAVDMTGNPMPDVPIEDLKQGVVVAERCFGTSAWPMVQKFSIEGRLVYDAGRHTQPAAHAPMPTPIAKQSSANVPAIKVPKPRPAPAPRLDEDARPAVPDATSIAPSEKSSFVGQRSQMTLARAHANSQQPRKIYECLLPLLEKRQKNPLLLRFSAVPITSEINGDYSVVSFVKDESVANKLIISLQSLDIPNKVIEFETTRSDIHIKKIEEISAAR